uniref:Isoleucine--tRNA ligase n=1 Tax=Noccaea caerulescens TaxID=107243 RepID=A0A1J3H7L9_NOCCA
MGEYKLYNVLPLLIRFLDLLTNWYVRLNRARLKGEAEEDAWTVSLNVLFDVLLKVNVLMSPQVPFITEHMFQNLRLVLREGSPLAEPSVHLLRIAEANPRLLNPTVTEQMANFMSLVETARKLREQKKVSLKQPISSLTVVARKAAVFEGLSAFLQYIREEVNVEDIRHEPNVEKYVKLDALPNLPVLGPKFKGNKAFGDVKTAIGKLTTAELEQVR